MEALEKPFEISCVWIVITADAVNLYLQYIATTAYLCCTEVCKTPFRLILIQNNLCPACGDVNLYASLYTASTYTIPILICIVAFC